MRASTNVIEVVTAEDIGKLPDKNIADVLQRIPGVNTQSAASGEGGFDENNRVSIRGTSASLTQTTINGHSVSTGDWFINDQYQTAGTPVAFSDLIAGDLVFWGTSQTVGSSVYHTAIYVGGDRIVEATGDVVQLNSLGQWGQSDLMPNGRRP